MAKKRVDPWDNFSSQWESADWENDPYVTSLKKEREEKQRQEDEARLNRAGSPPTRGRRTVAQEAAPAEASPFGAVFDRGSDNTLTQALRGGAQRTAAGALGLLTMGMKDDEEAERQLTANRAAAMGIPATEIPALQDQAAQASRDWNTQISPFTDAATQQAGSLQKMADANSREVEQWRATTNPGWLKEGVIDVASTPSMLLSVWGGPGALIAGADVTGQEYIRGKQEGLSDKDALDRARVMGTIEAGTSAIPTGKLFRSIPGVKKSLDDIVQGNVSKWAKRTVNQMAGEGLQETTATLGQLGADATIAREADSEQLRTFATEQLPKTTVEFFNTVRRSAVAGAIGGGTFAQGQVRESIISDAGKLASDMMLGDLKHGKTVREPAELAKQLQSAVVPEASPQLELFPDTTPGPYTAMPVEPEPAAPVSKEKIPQQRTLGLNRPYQPVAGRRAAEAERAAQPVVEVQPIVQTPQKKAKITDKQRETYKTLYPELVTDEQIEAAIAQDKSGGDTVEALKKRVGLPMRTDASKAGVTPEQVVTHIANRLGKEKTNALAKLIGDGKVVLDNADSMPVDGAGAYDPTTGVVHINTSQLDPKNITGSILEQVAGHEFDHAARTSGNTDIKRSLGDLFSEPATKKLVADVQKMANGKNVADKKWAENVLAQATAGSTPETFEREVAGYAVSEALKSRQKGAHAVIARTGVSALRTWAKKNVPFVANDLNVKDLAYLSDRVVSAAARTDKSLKGAKLEAPLQMIMGEGSPGYAQAEKEGRAFKDPADGKMKYITSDVDSALQMSQDVERTLLEGKPVHTQDFLKHDELYEQYPPLANTTVRANKSLHKMGASYTEENNTMYVSEHVVKSLRAGKPWAKALVLHELQHGIQGIEDFARGGNEDQFISTKDSGTVAAANFWEEQVTQSLDNLKDLAPTIPDRVTRSAVRRALAQRLDGNLTNKEALDDINAALAKNPDPLSKDMEDWKIRIDLILEKVTEAAPARTKIKDEAYKKYLSLRGEQEARFVQYNSDLPLDQLPLTPFESPDYEGETRVSKKIGDVNSGSAVPAATKSITLSDGTKVELLLEDASQTPGGETMTPGQSVAVGAYLEDGTHIGGADFVVVEEADGMRYNPSVEVDAGMRRKGLATEIYKFAEENGAKIPKLSQKGQVRTEEGQAFRESEKMAPLAMKLQDAADFYSKPDVNTTAGKAMQIAKAQFLYHSGLGKELFERLKLSTGEASRDAQRGLNAGANVDLGIKRLAKHEGKTVEEVRTMVEKRMDALSNLPTPEARERALASLVRQYPNLRSLAEAYSDIDQLTKTLVAQMLRAQPNPTEADIKFMNKILNNSFGYTTRMYAAFQGEAGSAYAKKLMDDYKKAQKRMAKDKTLNPAQEKALERVDNAVRYIAKHDLTIPTPEKIGSVSLDNLKYLYDSWIGDADHDYKLAKDAARKDGVEESGVQAAAQDKLIEALLDFAPSLDTAAIQEKAKEAVDNILKLGDNTGAVPKYLRTASADRGILQKREELPAPIRELLGEIKDPGTRVQATIAKQGELVARNKFLLYMKEHGEGKWVVRPQELADGKFTSTLDGDGFGALKGWKTTPQIAAVIKDQLGMFSSTADAMAQGFAGADAQQAAWYRTADDWLRKGAGAAKVASIIMEGFNTVANATGSIATFVANGAPIEQMYNGSRQSMELIINELVGNKGKLSDDVLDAIAHGVTDSAKVNELKQQAQQQVRDSLTGQGPVTQGGKLWNTGKKTATEIFAQSDVWPKLAAFKHRKNVMRRYYDAAGIDMTDEQISAEAATVIKDANISSDRVPPILKSIEARGITRFMPYFWNVPRSLVMSAAHGANDLVKATMAPTAEAKMILGFEGIRRLTGTGAATAGLMVGLKGLASALNGDDEDEVEDIKKVLSPEARYGDLVYLGKDDTGAPIFFRMSRVDPYGPVTDLVRMLLDPDTKPEEMGRMTTKYVQDLAFANTYTKVVMDALSDTIGNGKMKDKMVRLERIMPRMTSYLKDGVRAVTTKESLAQASVALIDTQTWGILDALDPNNKSVTDAKNDASQITADLVKYSGGRLDRADPGLRAYMLGQELKDRRDEARKRAKEYQSADRPAAALREARKADQDIYYTMQQLRDVYDGMVDGLKMSPRAAQAALKDADLTAADVSMIVRGRTPSDLEKLKTGQVSRIFSESSMEMRDKNGDKMLSAKDRAAALEARKKYVRELTEAGAAKTK